MSTGGESGGSGFTLDSAGAVSLATLDVCFFWELVLSPPSRLMTLQKHTAVHANKSNKAGEYTKANPFA